MTALSGFSVQMCKPAGVFAPVLKGGHKNCFFPMQLGEKAVFASISEPTRNRNENPVGFL